MLRVYKCSKIDGEVITDSFTSECTSVDVSHQQYSKRQHEWIRNIQAVSASFVERK